MAVLTSDVSPRSSDFKARRLSPDGEHPLYDLRRCFDIGWATGFRGPWCIEHGNVDTAAFIRETRMLGDMLREWIAESRSDKGV